MVSEEVARRLLELGTECEFSAGSVLMALGEPGAGLYLIRHGTVLVHAPGGDSEHGPGEVVGELALLSPDGMRTARVTALTDVRAVAVDRATLEREGLV